MDEDLEVMTRERLIEEARQLRAGIRAHRDSTGHALVLASSQAPGAPTGEDGPRADDPYLAGVSAGLHSVPTISG